MIDFDSATCIAHGKARISPSLVHHWARPLHFTALHADRERQSQNENSRSCQAYTAASQHMEPRFLAKTVTACIWSTKNAIIGKFGLLLKHNIVGHLLKSMGKQSRRRRKSLTDGSSSCQDEQQGISMETMSSGRMILRIMQDTYQWYC